MRRTIILILAGIAALYCGPSCRRAEVPSSGHETTAPEAGEKAVPAEAAAAKVQALGDGLALTPPMGWYPWNIFGEESQNEKLIREVVEAIVASGMKDAGYTYVGPDEGICFYRGSDGTLETNLERYPSGLRKIGDDIHAKGLKYALYTDAGQRTCSGAMPGTEGHELEDMRRFAEWRADYLKIDWCNTEGQDIVKTYTLLHEAQRAAGRPIVHSLCSWGEGEPWKWAAGVGHLWRTTGDICAPGRADWARDMGIVAENEKLAAFAGPGHWCDPDMMIAGMPGLSDAQNRSFFSLWCMMAAPLMAGNDVRDMSKAVIDVLTNIEAIAVNQDPLGVQGRIVREEGNVSIWAGKPLFDGSQAVLLFNRGSEAEVVMLKMEELGMEPTSGFYLRDLWAHSTSDRISSPDGLISVMVAAHDVKLLRASRAEDFPVPPIVVADTYRIFLKAAGDAPETLTGTITVVNKGSSDLPLWRQRLESRQWPGLHEHGPDRRP
jgi:alpha-galactosidase